MKRGLWLPLLGLLWPGVAAARPAFPEAFCGAYPESPLCVAGPASCTVCHSLSGPPARNPYGADVVDVMERLDDPVEALLLALPQVHELDSDEDGTDNLDEILGGSLPGFEVEVEPECAAQADHHNPWYELGSFDPEFAFKRVTLDFCGRSPRYEERQVFAAAADPRAALDEQLAACLRSPYWAQVLDEIGTQVVRPVGPGTDVNILGNWQWDLRLWRWAVSGDRDAGDLLRATYLVVEEPPLSGQLMTIEEPRNELEAYAQPLAAEDRFGLVTTRYSLAMNVMFADVPRTLVAHYYRTLLGLDLARAEGLYPVDELNGTLPWDAPADVDELGVWQEGCAACHATLDPLAYPWARYNGIDLDGDTTGSYLPERASDILPTVDGHIFGVPVSTPEEWVELAVTSDEFAAQTTRLFFHYLFRRAPFSCEQEEFDRLWRSFRDEGRNVEAMLSRLIHSDLYGTP